MAEGGENLNKLVKIGYNTSTLVDEEIVHRISNAHSNLSPDNLRKQRLRLVKKRGIELSRVSRHKSAGLFVEE